MIIREQANFIRNISLYIISFITILNKITSFKYIYVINNTYLI